MSSDQLTRLRGQSVIDSAGQKIGDIQRVFYDEANNQPAWVTVRGGRMGSREAFVPLAGAQLGSAGLAVAIRKEIVDDAPAIDAGNEMTADDAARLDRYYEGILNGPAPRLQPPAQTTTPGPQQTPQQPMPTPGPPPRRPQPERPAPESAPTPPTRTETATQPAELTSFEEQIRVGTEAVESGTVRLRKYVVTEPVETSVPIRREDVTVERVPAASATPSPGHQFEEQAVEVTLHEERPTIAKETVPVETVRLTSKTETEQRQVSDQVRRERIEVEDQRGNAPGSAKHRR